MWLCLLVNILVNMSVFFNPLTLHNTYYGKLFNFIKTVLKYLYLPNLQVYSIIRK